MLFNKSGYNWGFVLITHCNAKNTQKFKVAEEIKVLRSTGSSASSNRRTKSTEQSPCWEVRQAMKCYAFYGNPRSISVFTISRSRSLPGARWVQFTSLVLLEVHSKSSHLRLGLTDGLFPLCMLAKFLYAFLLFPVRVTFRLKFYLYLVNDLGCR
jgi:hypothetical protein